VTGARTLGRTAYATARLGPGDIHIVELYDAFTPSLSTRSFSARSRLLPERGAGPSYPTVISHRGRSAGRHQWRSPLLRHPGMCGSLLLIEAVRQLRRECGAGQIADCETAIAHGNVGVLSQRTVILGT
jgi:hypothetical protein